MYFALNSGAPVASYLIGIFVALAIFAAAYFLLMLLYLKLRRKMSGAKFLPEFLTLAIVMVLNIVVKFALVFGNMDFGGKAGADGHALTLEYGILDLFRSVYAGIGNFGFEGIEGLYATSISKIMQMLYYGSSLLTAIVFASVILATANYEFFSRLSLFAAKRFGKKDVYIFTALTEETILLAESIASGENEEENKGRKAMIIFAGPCLESFDRKNDLCRRVMANGFFYWSYNENEKSITKALRLHVRNGLDSIEKKKRPRVVVFSFNAKEHIPTEEENMDFVFNDIRRHIEEIREGKRARVIKRILRASFIEYYVLTQREVNYQAYQYKVNCFRADIEGMVAPVLMEAWSLRVNGETCSVSDWTKVPQEEKDAFLNATFRAEMLDGNDNTYRFFTYQEMKNKEVLALLTYMSNVSVWNEATAISYSAINAFQDVINRYPQDFKDFYEKNIHVCSVGYGLTAQTIVKNLYVQTSYIFEDDSVSTFHVEAFDPSATEIAGLLQYENPLTVCFDVEKTESSSFNEEEAVARTECGDDYNIMRPIDKHIVYQTAKIRENILSECDVHCDNPRMSHDKEISPMAITVHNISALNFDFIKKLDELTGEGADLVRPQFITVATGDDFRNIKLVNAIVLDILKEVNGKKQIIFMNVWDEKNLDLINRYNAGSDVDAPSTVCYCVHGAKVYRFSDRLTLIVVGNNSEIYSKQSVISYREIAKYAVNYNRASDMGGLEMEVLFEDSATNEDYTRYVSDPNDILRDENKKPFGVIMKIADAVNRIVGDYAMGRKLPMSEEMCCNVFSAFCDLTRASKEEVLALEGTDCVLGGILDDLDNKKKTAKFFKYVDHLDFYVWKCWCGAQLWEKESNLSAYMFGYVYRRLLDEKKSKGESFSFTDYIRIVNIEHQRWMRIHMCNGWTFGKKKIKGRRIHDCILPLYAIDANESYSYDLINAAWGMIKK